MYKLNVTHVFLLCATSRSEFDTFGKEVLMKLLGCFGLTEVGEDVVFDLIWRLNPQHECGKNFRINVLIYLPNALHNPIS